MLPEGKIIKVVEIEPGLFAWSSSGRVARPLVRRTRRKKKPIRVSTFTLHLLQERYPFVCNVEQTIPHTFIKRDLFGFADYIAMDSAETVLVQVTTKKNMEARRAKILANPASRLWLVGERRRILLHGWNKLAGQAEPELFEDEITPEDYDT
jgi:hypothetical protein